MKNFVRIGLPILLVFGVVFIITIAQRYTTDPEEQIVGPDSGRKTAGGTRVLPLRFFTVAATSAYTDPDNAKPHLKYWNPSVEIGQPGSLEFLCQNQHPEPITVNIQGVSCQCVGTHLGVIPKEAWLDYVTTSALGASPLNPSPMLMALAAHVQLSQKIHWDTLKAATENSKEIIDNKLEVPAADPKYGPQMAFVRVGWTGKPPAEPKRITADVIAQIGKGSLSSTTLEANIATVSPFAMFRRESEKRFVPTLEVTMDDLRLGSSSSQEIYLLSATRFQPIYSVTFSDGLDPCFALSAVVEASPEERKNFEDYLASEPKAYRGIKSLYKFTVTAHERVEQLVDGKKTVRQLDLGLWEKKLTITALTSASEPTVTAMFVKGRVYGELSISSGADTGRIELGNSFPVNEDRSKDITIVAERSGLDIALVKEEINPSFLQVTLEPLSPAGERKRWRVRVTVPKGKLFGALPINSAIVLTTNDPTPRRIRIPIRGMSADTGGSRPDL